MLPVHIDSSSLIEFSYHWLYQRGFVKFPSARATVWLVVVDNIMKGYTDEHLALKDKFSSVSYLFSSNVNLIPLPCKFPFVTVLLINFVW